MLAELLIVLLLSTLATTYALRQAVKDAETLSAKALGEQATMLAQGLDTYIYRNYATLGNSQPVIGVANPLVPTYQELLDGGYIDLNVGNKSVFGQNFLYKVELKNCPGLNCSVSGYVYTDKAVLQANGTTINEGIAITAQQTIGYRGGATYSDAPNVIRGLSGAAKVTTNPIAGQAGLVFAFAGSNSSALSAFYKKSGDTLEGPMNGNNQKIQSLELLQTKDVQATNDVAAKTVTATDMVTGNKFVDKDDAKFMLDPSGDSNLKTATLEDGKISKRSTKLNLSDLLSMDVVQTSAEGITSPSNITKPSCAAAASPTPLIDVTVQSASSPEGTQVQIVDLGATWRVQILEGAGGLPLSGSIFSYRTYCRYDKS
ncbi:MAG: hypothetical protein JNM52_09425 [Betaproteobacteria bacterium]|nr:hypothetical protein [Betaproteobacteria bacterium]